MANLTNLQELKAAIEAGHMATTPLDHFPVFGGRDMGASSPVAGFQILSWDATHVLLGTHNLSLLTILKRVDSLRGVV